MTRRYQKQMSIFADSTSRELLYDDKSSRAYNRIVRDLGLAQYGDNIVLNSAWVEDKEGRWADGLCMCISYVLDVSFEFHTSTDLATLRGLPWPEGTVKKITHVELETPTIFVMELEARFKLDDYDNSYDTGLLLSQNAIKLRNYAVEIPNKGQLPFIPVSSV